MNAWNKIAQLKRNATDRLTKAAGSLESTVSETMDNVDTRLTEASDAAKKKIAEHGGLGNAIEEAVAVSGEYVGMGAGYFASQITDDPEETNRLAKYGRQAGENLVEKTKLLGGLAGRALKRGKDYVAHQLDEHDVTDDYRTITLAGEEYVIAGDTKSQIDGVKAFMTHLEGALPEGTDGRDVLLQVVAEEGIASASELKQYQADLRGE